MKVKEALTIAENHDLSNEVAYGIYNLELSPEEALREWDLL